MRVRRFVVAGAIAVAGAANVVALAPPSDAVTVPNIYNCSRATHHCRQQNGAYVPSVPSACHWVNSIYLSDNNFHGCTYWY